MRSVLRLKKNAAAKPISTRVIKGVASPNRNQAIIHGGKEIEMSLIVAAAARESRGVFNRSIDRWNGKTMSVDWALNVVNGHNRVSVLFCAANRHPRRRNEISILS